MNFEIISIRIATIVSSLCLSFCIHAQENELSGGQESLPEEIQVIGDRSILQLKTQMMEAELKAYEIFNKFNDEKRFNIQCTMHKPTGSNLQRQVCISNFEIEASGDHAQAYYDDMFGATNTVHIPFEFLVASQQQEYKQKMKEVAEQHPEFLNAIIEFGEIRQRYDAATSTGTSE